MNMSRNAGGRRVHGARPWGARTRGWSAAWLLASSPAFLGTAALVALPVATVLVPSVAHAKLGADEAPGVASGELDGIEKDIPTISAALKKVGLRTAEQMLTDGELLFRTKDYQKAILVFSQVEVQYPSNKAAYAEAVYRNGEALYATKDYLSARTKFKIVAEHAKDGEYKPYAAKAIARLVDIAMKVDDPKDPKTIDEVLGRIAALPPSDVDSVILYAKGKALFFKGDLEPAKATLASVGPDGGFQHQARFVLGVIALKQSQPGKYQAAIDAFKKVTDLPGDTDEHKEVIDLSWIAMGRLFYEMDMLDEAVLAYQHVDKTSKHFDTFLYEIAWVYVRKEDQEKATRALELLALTSPDGPYSIEGDLLKADIQLRKGEFKKALETYEHVRDAVDPLRKRVDDYLNSGKSPGDYYAKLVSQNPDALDGPDALPPIAVKWAKEGPDGALAFSVVDSVQQTRQLLTEAQDMLDKLQAVVKNNAIKAFPGLKAQYEKVILLENRLAVARAHVGQGLDDAEPSEVGGELATVREQRRRLQKYILGLPVDDDGLSKREEEAVAQWRVASQELQKRKIEIDMLQAQATALRKYIKTKGGDPNTVAEHMKTLDSVEIELKQYTQEYATLKKQVELGKAQLGLGDQKTKEDAEAREQYRDLLEKEIGLAANLGGQSKSYADKANPVMAKARLTEGKILEQKKVLDDQIKTQSAGLKAELDAHQAALDGYRDQLAKFEDEAKETVGAVAKRNFGLVKDKLTTLVMRAEVGIIDQAWKERDVRKLILRDRQVELKDAEKLLDDELKQINNDGAGFE